MIFQLYFFLRILRGRFLATISCTSITYRRNSRYCGRMRIICNIVPTCIIHARVPITYWGMRRTRGWLQYRRDDDRTSDRVYVKDDFTSICNIISLFRPDVSSRYIRILRVVYLRFSLVGFVKKKLHSRTLHVHPLHIVRVYANDRYST